MNENTKVGSKTQAQLAALEARQAYMEKEQHSTRKRLEDMKKINWLVVVGTITLDPAKVAPFKVIPDLRYLSGIILGK